MKYGIFGGQYVPQELKPRLNEIEQNFKLIKKDKEFNKKYVYYLKNYIGRPSSLYFAENLTNYLGGCKIY